MIICIAKHHHAIQHIGSGKKRHLNVKIELVKIFFLFYTILQKSLQI